MWKLGLYWSLFFLPPGKTFEFLLYSLIRLAHPGFVNLAACVKCARCHGIRTSLVTSPPESGSSPAWMGRPLLPISRHPLESNMNQPHHATGQTASPAAGQGLLERLFALLRSWHHGPHRGDRRHHHLPDHGLHRLRQPADPLCGRHGHPGRVRYHLPHRRCRQHPDGSAGEPAHRPGSPAMGLNASSPSWWWLAWATPGRSAWAPSSGVRWAC